MSFNNNDETQIFISSCLATLRPIDCGYYERGGVPNLRMSVRIQNVDDSVRYDRHEPQFCLFEEQDGESSRTAEELLSILRSRGQVFSCHLRPRGDRGEPLTYRNWMNFRRKMEALVSALHLAKFLKGSTVELLPVSVVELKTEKQQVAALKKVVKATVKDTEELAEVIQKRLTEVKGTDEPFSFVAEIARWGTNYNEREVSGHMYLQRYINIRYIR